MVREFTLHPDPAERDMDERVRRIEQEANRLERREDEKNRIVMTPVDLWLEGGTEDGGILVIHGDTTIRPRIMRILRRRRYKVQQASGEREVMLALRKASYSLMIVPWAFFESSSDFVGLLRRAFPQTKIIITSPRFAWSSESVVGANLGKEALEAGAYSYVPDPHIDRSLLTCVDSAMKSKERACPVLMAGLPCNLLCRL